MSQPSPVGNKSSTSKKKKKKYIYLLNYGTGLPCAFYHSDLDFCECWICGYLLTPPLLTTDQGTPYRTFLSQATKPGQVVKCSVRSRWMRGTVHSATRKALSPFQAVWDPWIPYQAFVTHPAHRLYLNPLGNINPSCLLVGVKKIIHKNLKIFWSFLTYLPLSISKRFQSSLDKSKYF